jgi:hypothetical protein
MLYLRNPQLAKEVANFSKSRREDFIDIPEYLFGVK